MPVDHQVEAAVLGFASAVFEGACKVAREGSDPHMPQILEIPTARITYIRPNGVDINEVIFTEPSFMRRNQGTFFHFRTDSEGVKREVAMRFETMPGAPTEVVSSGFLTVDEIEVLTLFAANPVLIPDLARSLMTLTRAERQIKDRETDRNEEELNVVRENCEDATFVPQRGYGW